MNIHVWLRDDWHAPDSAGQSGVKICIWIGGTTVETFVKWSSSGHRSSGGFGLDQAGLAQAWIEIHRDDLAADWTLAVEGRELFKIDPLK